MKKYQLCLLVSTMLLASCEQTSSSVSSSSSSSTTDEAIPVTLLTTGWINTPVSGEDPYREWIKENYGLDITLIASNDFDNDVIIKFASNNKPDIVSFNSISSYKTIADQGVLIDDWSKYLTDMPEMCKMLYSQREEGATTSVAEKVFSNEQGNIKTLWTNADPAIWSLKIREDWAQEMRNSDPSLANWNPLTPDDLLTFARWIRDNKPGCYGFTSAGARASFGTLGNYISLFFGYVNELPWGFYVTDDNNVEFGLTDGCYQKYLDYIKTIVSEGLIDPQWYEQDWDHKTKTKEGKIGIEWYPGTITYETETYQKDKLEPGESSVDWWKTYNIPSDGGKYSGYMVVDSFFNNIITVSKKCSLNSEKMKRICKLLNDVVCYTTVDSETGETKYVRGKAYDALRWGIGIEPNISFQDIEGTSYKYICTANQEGEEEHFRNSSVGQGAWDWGAWFSTTGDGVINGASKEVDEITMKVYEHNAITSEMKCKVQIGASLTLDSQTQKTCQSMIENYSYKYVTGQNTGYASYEAFLKAWMDKGGDDLYEEAKEQFIELGYIK